MPRDPDDWPFLERLAFLIELRQHPAEQRAGVIAQRGLSIAQVEAWRVEAQKRLPGLVRPKQRATKPR